MPAPRRARRAGEERPLLDQFAAGPENRFAAFVCRQTESIADRGNPLLLVGPSGSGKTALAMTIAAAELTASERAASDGAVAAPPPDEAPAPVLLMPAVDFARGYAEAVDADDLDHYRRRLGAASVLVIDDVHMLTDKPAAQEELAARIERRTLEQRPTILTCRRLPTELRGIRPLLSSRMLPGLTVPLALPGPEARIWIVQQLLQSAKLSVDADVVDLLCRGLPAGLPARRLGAAVNHLRLWCRNAKLPPDSRAVQATIDAVGTVAEPSMADIAKAVARRFKLKTSDLKSSTRRQQVVRARALAMFLGRQLTDASLQQIGEFFGGRDHTTVLHACRKTEQLLATSHDLSRTADEVVELLRVPA